MDTKIVFTKMLVLFAMMMVGYWCGKKEIISAAASKKLSLLTVYIFNPSLTLANCMGAKLSDIGSGFVQTILFTALLYIGEIVFSWFVVRIIRIPKKDQGVYRCLMIFGNLGFIGIPLVVSLYGSHAVIFQLLYFIVYNILCYTYGAKLISTSSGKVATFSIKDIIFNVGIIASVGALIIFVLGLDIPDSVSSLFTYLGNPCIPVTIMCIGASLSRMELKDVFGHKESYLFCFFKMLVVPIVFCLVMRGMSLDPTQFGIFILMLAMPPGSMVTMMSEKYDANTPACARETALCTVLSVITIPIVSMFV